MKEDKKSEEKNNLELWEKVCKTDPAHTKKAKIGQHQITAIDAHYQVMNATRELGSYGIGWGIEAGTSTFTESIIGQTVLVSYQGIFFYKLGDDVGRFDICSSIKKAYMTRQGTPYLVVDDEYAKKLMTDAMTKALSKLGFNADIFLGKFDDNRYVAQMKEEFGNQVTPAPEPTPAKKQTPAPQATTYEPDPIEWIKQYSDLTDACKAKEMTMKMVAEIVNECGFDYGRIKAKLDGGTTNGFK